MIKKYEEVVPLAHHEPLSIFIGKGSHSIYLKQSEDKVVIHRKDIPKVIKLLEALKAKFDYEDHKACGSCKFSYRREQSKRGGWYGCSRHLDAEGGHKSLGTWQMRHENCGVWEYNGEGNIVPLAENAEMMHLLYGNPIPPDELERPCLGCGFCCVQAPCGLSPVIAGVCASLYWDLSNSMYRCSNKRAASMFGTGCSSSMNTWRNDVKEHDIREELRLCEEPSPENGALFIEHPSTYTIMKLPETAKEHTNEERD